MSGKNVEEGENQQKKKQEYQLINPIGTHADCVTEGPNANTHITKPEE